MAAPLRQCPHCRLVFEDGNICPACRRDITTAPESRESGKNLERRKTREVPKITPRPPRVK